MEPTIGRIVIYKPTEEEKKTLAKSGNACDQLPAIIVNAFGDDVVNLKVQTDGTDSAFWKSSTPKGDNEGEWNWPERK